MKNIFVGQLVESFSRGFGRVSCVGSYSDLIEIQWTGYNGAVTILYTLDEAISCLHFYNKEETGYISFA